MKIIDFLEKLFEKNGDGSSTRDSTEGVVKIDIPASLYYKELALYTASSLIANAISMSEIKVFKENKSVKDADYFTLNVAPNKNETASHFWHKVINKMIRDQEGCLVVEVKDKLHVAESFGIKEERPVLGNIYENVTLKNLTLTRKQFRAEEVFLFKMENENVKKLLDGMYNDYEKVMKAAIRAYKDTNGRKFKFHVTGVKAGDEKFNEEFNTYISQNIRDYMEGEFATYVEYDGEDLQEQSSNKQAKSSDDVINIRKDIFEMFGQAFKIPAALMNGDITSIKDVCDVFLTFAVDPLANAITQTLNKRAGIDNFQKGNYYKCYTGGIKHRDLFDSASAADKLLSTATMCVDEIREELDLDPLNTEWSSQFYLTKNYEKVENAADPVGGGES